MKRLLLLLIVTLTAQFAIAQRTIQMRDIWMRPQVHVLFEGYTLSFTIRDIDRAMLLLAQAGDTSVGFTSGLDTSKDYFCELYSGVDMQYHNRLQVIMQHGVGAFLLLSGRAYIENKRHKQMQRVIVDIRHNHNGEGDDYLIFYDPKHNARVFTGRMNVQLYNKDLGLE